MELNRFISKEHASALAVPVPEVVHIYPETLQGDSLGHNVGTVVQFYTGNNFGYFVCVLSFEDWESERCPRFTWYTSTERGGNIYLQCTNPSEKYSYDDVR